MASLFLVPHIESDDGDLNINFDEVFAALDEIEERQSTDPEVKRARLRKLGAVAHLAHDLSDADPLWVAHTCTSDDRGICTHCEAAGALGELVPR